MSVFKLTMLQAITIMAGLAIGYFFNKTSLKFWRVLVGFLLGFTFSWIAGTILWAFLFMSNNPHAAIVDGMPKSFLFAIFSSGLGVYFGRRKAKFSS